MSGLTTTPEEALARRLDIADRRVILTEARAALEAEGAISPRIADIYIEDVGDKAKIDPATGDAIGIREPLAAWKESHQEFFRQPAQTTATATQTAKGSLAPGELPDLRKLDAKARRAAMDAYKQSLRSKRPVR